MSKEHCCCGSIHVKIGALIIGSLVLIFGITGLLASVIIKTDANSTVVITTDANNSTMQQPDDATSRMGTVNIIGIVINALSVIIGGCIIYADRSRKPGGYLPYLILTAIGIVIYTIFIAFYVIMAIAVPETLSNYTQNYGYVTQDQISWRMYPNMAMRVMFLFGAAAMALTDWIAIWFWIVVYRAYQHMKDDEEYDRGRTYFH